MHKLVLLAIADYAGRDNNSAWPSGATLAARCGVSRRTVDRSLAVLVKGGFLTIDSRPNKTNLYHLRCVTESHEPVRNQSLTSKDDEQVEALYAAYPRKIGKPAALTSIRKALKREAAKADLGMTPAALLAKTRLWATACQQRTAEEPDSAKYIKHPSTWFNQQCYLEPAAEWGIKSKPKSLSSQLNDEVIRASERDLEKTRKLLESL